ncbi:MAG: single-stranded-DNA-specific exonuclease RecJ [Candidatus Krumholzibacteriia bacterium]
MTRLPGKFHWEEKETPDPACVERLVQALGTPPAGARFLSSRGMTTPEEAAPFLSGSGTSFHDPFRFDHMERAVTAVRGAIDRGRRILIHGDYDVDGICGTALLYEFLCGLVPHVFRFLPDRRKDGYGIARRGVEWAIEHEVGLFIAVDCGTSDVDNVARLEEAGMEIVVCDHHEFPIDRPAGGIMLNPVRAGESYPFGGLCGAGVALKLVQALEASGVQGRRRSDELLDLATLATVGDVAPLVDENRLLVRRGLEFINQAPRPGIAALKHVARLAAPEITASHIGFLLAPRLNAPGRISNPKPALQILCSRERLESERLARILEADNEHRRNLTEKVSTDVARDIRSSEGWQRRGAFVLAGEDWDEGVLGIAAARVAEEFGRPALLISTAGGIAKGSGRSVPGVHLKEQLDHCKSFLTRFGGHAQAVGFSLEPGKIDAFREEFTRRLAEVTSASPGKARLDIDADVTVAEATMELVDFLGACEPFGNGNRTPMWKLANVRVGGDTRWVGNGHLKLFLADSDGHKADGICFNWENRAIAPEVLHGRAVDMAVTLKKGYYRNRHRVEIHVADIRQHEG